MGRALTGGLLAGALLALATPGAVAADPADPADPDGEPPVETFAFAGDSVLLGVVPPLMRALEHSDHPVDSTWFIGFLDPNADRRWAELLAEPPDVLFFMLGPWEAQLLRRDVGIDDRPPGWQDRYRTEYVEPHVADLVRHGVDVVWLAMPMTHDGAESAAIAQLNAIGRRVAADTPSITWVETADLVRGAPPGREPIRKPDAVHLCPRGGERIATRVLDVLDERHGVVVDPSWVDTGWEWNPHAYGYDGCEATPVGFARSAQTRASLRRFLTLDLR